MQGFLQGLIDVELHGVAEMELLEIGAKLRRGVSAAQTIIQPAGNGDNQAEEAGDDGDEGDGKIHCEMVKQKVIPHEQAVEAIPEKGAGKVGGEFFAE